MPVYIGGSEADSRGGGGSSGHHPGGGSFRNRLARCMVFERSFSTVRAWRDRPQLQWQGPEPRSEL